MLRTKTPGKLQFSVDLFQVADQTSLTEHQRLSDAVRRVAFEFSRHRLPLTWALPRVSLAAVQELFPSNDFDMRRNTSAATRPDFAILVDETWPSISNGDEFQRELQDRLDEAADRQVPISSLALSGPVTPAHASAAQACQLRVLRSGPTSNGSQSAGSAMCARTTGFMVVETTAALPGRRRFLAYNDTGFAAKQAIYRAMKGGSNEHIAIRMSDLIARPEKLSTTVQRIVALTSKLEQVGRVHVGTLRTISLHSLRKGVSEKRSTPSRSILSPAA